MDLASWLSGRGADGRRRSIAGLAAKAGTTRHVIYDVRDGHVPRISTARKISEATNGEVSVAELLQLKSGEVAA